MLIKHVVREEHFRPLQFFHQRVEDAILRTALIPRPSIDAWRSGHVYLVQASKIRLSITVKLMFPESIQLAKKEALGIN